MKPLFIAALLFCSIRLARGEETKDTKALQGTWTAEAAEVAGGKFPDATVKAMKLVISKDTYVYSEGHGDDKGKLRVDAAKSPSEMDIIGEEGPNKGKTYLCIYKLDGDTLTICYDLSGKVRPAEFKTAKGTLLLLVTYKRSK